MNPHVVHFYTLESEKHKLVHVGLYGTMEVPKKGLRRDPKSKRQVFHLHFACGRSIPRGYYKSLSERSKRFPTCIRCACWPKYPRR